MGQPYLDQDSFRWRDDDALAGTWLEATNDPLSNPESYLDTNIRLRFLLQNTGDKDETDGYRFAYTINGGTNWYPVTTTSNYVRSVSSDYFADGDSTSQEIGSGTHDEGYFDEASGAIAAFTFAQGQESENEFVFQFRSADISGHTIGLRMEYSGGGGLDSYTNEVSVTFPGPSLSQAHYRIRSGDAYGLNVDNGWAAGLDTGATIGTGIRFRVRFEVEEVNGVSTTVTLKLQYRRNAGSWYDLIVPGNNGATPIMIVDSAQYTDGDATTNVLSGSSKSFVAGTGEEDNTVGSVTLANEHTEIEFTLMLQNFFGSGGAHYQTVQNDVFELRLVESDNTALDSYTYPTITLDVTDYYIGGTYVEAPVRIGPFCDGNGNLYTLIEPYATTTTVMIMIKSTDGGKTWAEVDGANNPTYGDLESIDIVQEGTTLHIAHQPSTGNWPNIYYHTFRTSDDGSNPDTWGITDNEVYTGLSATDYSVAIAVRSDGDVVLFYRRTDTGYESIKYKINTGTWGGENTLDNTASTHVSAVRAVRGANDKIHVFYKDATNNDIYHKSLSSSDVLSGRESCYTDAKSGGTDYQEAMTPAVYWDDAGDEKVMVGILDNSDNLLYTVVVTNDGTPETAKVASDNTVYNNPGDTGSEQPVADLVVDQDADTTYIMYSDLTTHDLFRDVAVNDGGWGTDVEQVDAVDAYWVRGNVFTHSVGNGGKTVYGFTYDNGSNGYTGFIWYDEYEIAGGGGIPDAIAHRLRAARSPLLRM